MIQLADLDPELETLAASAAANAASTDQSGKFPRKVIDAFLKRGLAGLISAEAHGGSGGTIRHASKVVERLGRECGSTAMIVAMLRAESRTDFVAAVRALDRVLLSGFYVIPLYHAPEQWIARWAPIRHPDKTPLSGYLPEAWWREPGK